MCPQRWGKQKDFKHLDPRKQKGKGIQTTSYVGVEFTIYLKPALFQKGI
jgi:hypothetical protein